MTVTQKIASLTPKESRANYELVRIRAAGVCEICGKARATETHHRLHRSQGGQDSVENLIRVCGWGNHTGCHGKAHSDSLRYVNGWAVRSGYDAADVVILYRGRRGYLAADGSFRSLEVA